MKFPLLILILYGLIPGRECWKSNRDDLLVETTEGLVRGVRATDGDYSMYLGIPFGKVDPKNPFGPATPSAPFNGIFNASDDSVMCPQEYNATVTGTLDCLQLDVYVPNVKMSKRPLPVLVWIYGGSYVTGSAGRAIYGPRHLVKHDVILVSINYRLGPYGFMCFNTPLVPGNQGIKDQVLALRWIKRNVAAFGGDTNKITVFGESAGAISIDFHLFSHQEKLFNKMILQSGTAFCPTAFTEPNLLAPIQIADKLGYKTNVPEDALKYLSRANPLSVINASLILQQYYGPCVEKNPGPDAVLADYPVNLEARRKVANTPIMIGFNNQEMLFLYGDKGEEYYKTIGNVFYDRLDLLYKFNNNETRNDAAKFLRDFYLGDEPINIDAKQDLINFDSDYIFIHPALASIDRYRDEGAGNIYLYMFSYSGSRNYIKNIFNITSDGAAHADELGYLFDQETNYYKDITPEDQLIIDRITTLWTNFAKYSDPTPEVTKLIPVKWLPATEESVNYLNIDTVMKLQRKPFKERTAFWELFSYTFDDFLKGKELSKCH